MSVRLRAYTQTQTFRSKAQYLNHSGINEERSGEHVYDNEVCFRALKATAAEQEW